jgi:hypothetical protein
MDENNNATMSNAEYEPLLPDGWTEEDDLIGGDTDETSGVETEAEPEEAPASDESASPDNSEPSTTSESEEPGAEDTEEPPTTEAVEEVTAQPSRLRFRARIDHEDRDVEMDEADLPTIYQKAQATDRAQQRMREMQALNDRTVELARQMGYESPEKLLEEAAATYRANEIERMMEEGTAKSVAEWIVDQKMRNAGMTSPTPHQNDPDIPTNMHVIDSDQNDTTAAAAGQAQAPVGAAASGQSGQRDFSAEVAELLRARPQLVGKPLPDEVVNEATAGGRRLLDAYKDFEEAGVRKETERLRKENSVLKQNAEAAKRAPVKSSSDGGKTDTSPSDPFLAGFNSDQW